jgi:hypothetical protein
MKNQQNLSALDLAARGGSLPSWIRFEEPKGGLEVPPPAAADNKISLTREEYDRLTAARTELEQVKPKVARADELEKVWQDVESTLKADVDPSVREQSTRRILQRAGYSADQIEGYVKQTFGEEEEAPKKDDDNAELRRRLEAAERNAHESRTHQLRETLDRGIDSALDQDQDWSKLLGKLKDSRGDDGLKKARETITQDIQERTLAALRDRKAVTGKFEEAWIQEESVKAAKAVFTKYRTVIGDINLIGRSPETDSGEDEFLSSAPVPRPTFQKGMKVGDAQNAVRSFALDSLSRAAADLGSGDRSAI